MKSYKKFYLLMWKNFHLRKYHWFWTGMEILLPVLLVYVFVRTVGSFITSSTTHVNATIGEVRPIGQFYAGANHFSLFYAPATNLTSEIIQSLEKTLNFKQITAMKDETQMELFFSRNNSYLENCVGIVFLNTPENNSNNENFVYKFRSTRDWKTDILFPNDEEKGPFEEDPYFFNGFAGLQLAIDSTYIHLKTGETVDYNKVKFQSFPYPEYVKENQLRNIIPILVCIVLVLTLLILAIPLIKTIIEEKETGVKELMKIVGLNESLMWLSWFVNAFIICFISFTIVTILIQYDFHGSNTAAIRFIQPLILWAFMMLNCIAHISFCFFFTAVFHNVAIGSSIFILTYIIISFMALKVDKLNSIFLIQISCLFPVAAFIRGFIQISYHEIHDLKLTWSSLFITEKNSEISMGFIFLMLIFDTVIYSFATFYVIAINPGKFGSRKSPLFIFKNIFEKFVGGTTEKPIILENSKGDKFFEKVPRNLELGIQIQNLHKNFGSVLAVKNMNLNVYKGEITALLGHNGAGKTTTIEILTGLTKPTAGSITYNNRVDVLNRMEEFRRNLGLCPQEDRLLSYLSVMDHLLFFGMLKGLSKSEAIVEANQFLRLMEMENKAKSFARTLSGGMKRKLCLSIALIGKAEILILDEPTSGMDVESRRKIWDLLLALRKNRTIILTTQHMEEADVLGDRIAIMNHGTVVCHGTAMFLKKAYDTGYEVTITMPRNKQSELTNIIQNVMPSTEMKDRSSNEVVYKLPLTDTAKFPNLFQILETRKQDLGIKNIGVSCTTLEQVFLKVGGVSIFDFSERSRSSSETDGNLLSRYLERRKIGLSLMFQQLTALFMKKWLYTSRNLMHFLFRIVLPTLISMMLLRTPLHSVSSQPALDLSLISYPNSKVMLQNFSKSQLDFNNIYRDYVKRKGAHIIATDDSDIVQALLQYGQDNLTSFRREVLLASTFNDSTQLLLYNRIAIHSLPIAINTFSNVILQSLMKNKSLHITTINHPIKQTTEDQDESLNSDNVQIYLWFIVLVFYTIELSYYFASFLSTERIDGFKHIQFMSNVSPFIYWLGNFIFDFTFLFIIILLRIILFKTFDDEYNFLSIDSHLATLFLIIGTFFVSELFFVYVTNYISNSKEDSYVLLFVLNLFSAILTAFLYLYQSYTGYGSQSKEDLGYLSTVMFIVEYIVLFVPMFNYSLIFIKFFKIWNYNNRCSFIPLSLKSICEANLEPLPYLDFASQNNPNGMRKEFLFLIGDIILYAGLLSIIQYGCFNKLFNNILIRIYGSYTPLGDLSNVDTDVKLEQDKVHSYVNEFAEPRNSVVLLVHDLKKNFLKRFSPFTAVNNVTFAVKASECFGLLGVNGAGKSTTFKMLTADLLPTRGDASIMNKKLSTNKTEFLSSAGYCAQTNCFIEQLSGREILTLIARLRGIRKEQIKHLVDKWISVLDLNEYENERCGSYSGGNKRKLCTAMSLIGDPIVVFLDEPTTGVDPVSRRKLYDVMEHSKLTGQAVVLTSHSMEECENLCNRLTIMVKGNMKCIGTAQHLKQRYAQGFSILIKIDDTADSDKLTGLKNTIMNTFDPQDCVLKDEHKGLLYYQITDTRLLWSRLFKGMENVKNEHKIVEDYTITDTSLEEVFISFAKQQ